MVSEADGRIGGWAVGKTNIPRAIKPPNRLTAHPLIVHSPIDTPYSVRFLSLLPLDRRHPCAIDRQPGVRGRARRDRRGALPLSACPCPPPLPYPRPGPGHLHSGLTVLVTSPNVSLRRPWLTPERRSRAGPAHRLRSDRRAVA